MPSKLSERPEELVRQFLTDNLRSTEMQGYNPQQTDPTASDFLPVTSDWSNRGDHYPIIVVQENSGPSIPGSGTTNANGMQGDGSGVNQFAVHTVTVSCQAIEGKSYLNGVEAEDLVHTLYSEVHDRVQNNVTTAVGEALFTGVPTPPTQTRSTDEDDSGSTVTWIQAQGSVPVGVQYTP